MFIEIAYKYEYILIPFSRINYISLDGKVISIHSADKKIFDVLSKDNSDAKEKYMYLKEFINYGPDPQDQIFKVESD